MSPSRAVTRRGAALKIWTNLKRKNQDGKYMRPNEASDKREETKRPEKNEEALIKWKFCHSF
jgi:hypothetical protein